MRCLSASNCAHPLIAAMEVAELLPFLLLLAAHLVLATLQSLLLPPLSVSSLLKAVGLESPHSSVLPCWPVVHKVKLIILSCRSSKSVT